MVWTLLCLHILQPFQPTPAQVPTPLAGWMSNPTPVTHAAVSGGGGIGLGAPSIPGNTLFHFLFFSHSLCSHTKISETFLFDI